MVLRFKKKIHWVHWSGFLKDLLARPISIPSKKNKFINIFWRELVRVLIKFGKIIFTQVSKCWVSHIENLIVFKGGFHISVFNSYLISDLLKKLIRKLHKKYGKKKSSPTFFMSTISFYSNESLNFFNS